MEKHFYVYILRCADDTLYTGYTVDLKARLKKHQEGTASKYTRARLPVTLVYQEEHPSKQAATSREYAIKKFDRRQKLALVNGFKNN